MDEREFERLYEEHADGVFAFLAYRTGDRALAQDLLGDTFERAFRARARFNRRLGREKTWLYAIALNCLRDSLRRRRVEEHVAERQSVMAGEAGYHEPGFDRVEAQDELGRALQTLDADELEAVALRFGGDLSMPETARVMGRPLRTLERRVTRALEKLRAALPG